jgi:hypothetical protein
MKRNLLLPVLALVTTFAFSCKKKENATTCTLQVLKSPTGQNQSITANIDNVGYTNVDAQTLLADGGAPLHNYTWSLEASPTPPSGYIFWPLSGVIGRSGNTANGLTIGTKTIKVKVSDGTCSATGSVNIIVTGYTPGLAAVFQQLSSNFQLLSGSANKAYGASLFAMGGEPPYKWKLDATYAGSADLTNASLSVDESGGIVRGTILNSAAGKTIKFKVVVTDNAGDIAAYAPVYTIQVK